MGILDALLSNLTCDGDDFNIDDYFIGMLIMLVIMALIGFAAYTGFDVSNYTYMVGKGWV